MNLGAADHPSPWRCPVPRPPRRPRPGARCIGRSSSRSPGFDPWCVVWVRSVATTDGGQKKRTRTPGGFGTSWKHPARTSQFFGFEAEVVRVSFANRHCHCGCLRPLSLKKLIWGVVPPGACPQLHNHPGQGSPKAPA